MNATTVTLNQFQQTVAAALAAGCHDRGRLERAAALVVLGAVSKLDESTYAVRSQTDAGVTYTVTPDGCDCPDRKRHPLQRCKHDLAVRLILQAEVDAERAAEARRRVLADALVTAERVAAEAARRLGFAA